MVIDDNLTRGNDIGCHKTYKIYREQTRISDPSCTPQCQVSQPSKILGQGNKDQKPQKPPRQGNVTEAL